ncbi:unnamed protein product [Prunus brigantina]
METLVKLRDEGKWPTGTNVIYEIDSFQGEELKKVEKMADRVGLKMKEVINWYEVDMSRQTLEKEVVTESCGRGERSTNYEWKKKP